MSSTFFSHQQQLFNILETRLALLLDEHRRATILCAVEELITAGDVLDIQSLLLALSEQATNQPLWQKLIQVVTVGETYFFRDQNQLNALRLTVLPNLIAEQIAEGRRQLRLWSAGCSSGEEPYSLAILLQSLIPDISEWDVTILATDLNISSLERAQMGIYRPWSFRSETPEHIRQRWFIEEQGNYRIDHSISEMVTFAPLNLASDDYPSFASGTTEIDIILCRNVLIYLDHPTALAVTGRFQRALRPEGWLVLGHAESSHVAAHDFEPRNFEHAVLFQKRFLLEGDPAYSPVFAETPEFSRPALLNDRKATHVLASPTGLDLLEQARQATSKGQWQEALRCLTRAEKKEKMHPAVHYLRGVIELEQEEIDNALASLRRAIYCDGNFVLAHFALGEVYEKQRHYKKAFYQWNHAQTILKQLPGEDPIEFSDGLTVEMMSRLLESRLDHLPVQR